MAVTSRNKYVGKTPPHSQLIGVRNAHFSLCRAAPDTVDALASVTKPLTAAAVMVLVQRGAIDMEGPVTATGLLFQLRALDKAWTEVRVRNLLNHTSGLPTYFNLLFPDQFGARVCPSDRFSTFSGLR